MSYQFIIAAVDETGAGRHVAATALDLASRVGARLGLLTSIPSSMVTPARAASARSLLSDIETALTRQSGTTVDATCCVVRGVPGIEVPRHAEENGADLIVVGHTPRTQSARLLVGDTADAVTRRARVPCLLVPPRRSLDGPVVVALDGTRHSAAVLEAGCRLAVALGQPVSAVTVEVLRPDEATRSLVVPPMARSVRLEDVIAGVSQRFDLPIPLEVRRGDVIEELLAAADAHDAHTLVVGFHRGGPAGVMEAGSIGRRMVHGSGSAVLTVPI
ncbi:MAG TPA: universal stress protein [Gemmatimonadales bacterium]|jgi:nucleotide-binding universal stress UspA family protein|nr:universal stress protein [Gemmatimonadales bacterium]